MNSRTLASRRLFAHFRPRYRTLVALLAVAIFPDHAAGQVTTWTGAGNNDNWSNAANWSNGQVPTGSNTLEVFAFDSAVGNNLVQDLGDPFLINRIGINGSNGANYAFSGQAFEFAGTNSNLSVNNQGTTTVDNDWQLSATEVGASAGAGSQLIHNGDIDGSGALRTTGSEITLNGNFNHTGALLVANGRTNFNGSMADGDAVQVGGVLAGSGTIGVSTAPGQGRNVELVRFGNSNALTVQATGTMTINGDFNVLAPSSFNNSPQVLGDNLVVNGTTRVANGSLSIASTTFGGVGTIEVSRPGRLSIGSGTRVLSGQTINVGTDNSQQPFLSGGGTIEGTTNIGFGDTAGGSAIGSLTFDGDVNVDRGQFGTAQTFGNNATSRSSLTANGDVWFRTTAGNVSGDIMGAGRFNVENTATTSFNDATLISTDAAALTLNIDGRANMSGGSDINATVNVQGGFLSATQTTFAGTMNVDGGSTISSDASNQFNGNMIFSNGTSTGSGTLDGSGTFTNTSTGDLQFNGLNNLVATNQGQLIDGTYSKNLSLEGGRLGGTMALTDGLTVRTGLTSSINSGASVTVTNATEIQAGELRVESGAALQGNGALQVNATGILDVQGTVFKDVNVLEKGMLEGIGLIDGNLLINGMLGPGNSAGTLEIDGDIDLTDTSTVCIEIGGTDIGEFDVIDGRGVSTLNLDGGSLDISLLDGFRPDNLDRFDFFVNFASLSGAFGSSVGGAGGAGFQSFGSGSQRIRFDEGSFAIEYETGSVSLSDFRPVAVPEPTAFALLSSLSLALLIRRKRSAI